MCESTGVMDTLDLSEKKLKKLNKPSPEESLVTTLILDDNELQRLDSIDAFSKVQKLSAIRNQLLRMYGVCRLHNLNTLNLAHNGILTIEGLKDLVSLKYLNLAGNSIKTIEHLNTNINLEHLDISENQITHISDLSILKNLKELLLHNNKIGYLRQCDRFLPTSLTTLTLANNNIADLNEISQLVHLTNLYSVSIANNPCVNMTGQKVGFDYRPFVINWCPTVQVIDGYVVDAIESLRGEWLYSQGRGRHFRVGDQQELSQYLATVCPISGEQLETEEDRKLRLILSKAQHHQQQLREQGNSPIPSPVVRKRNQSAKNSPRLNSSRLQNNSARSPDPMTISCYNNSTTTSGIDTNCSIMSQSLDPTLLSQSTKHESNGICLDDPEVINSPLQALSKLVPVPESLMSPDYRPSPLISRLSSLPTPTTSQKPMPRLPQPVTKSPKMMQRNAHNKLNTKIANLNMENKQQRNNNSPSPVRNRRILKTASPPPPQSNKPLVSALKKSPSSEDESEMCASKLQTIQMKAVEKKQQKDAAEMSSASSSTTDEKAELAAIFIQKMWRGFHARNRDRQMQENFKTLQNQRADQYLQKLTNDMESTKAALESERKIQMLQMQAINALWKKVSALQPDELAATGSKTGPLDPNADLVNNLTQTCSSLQNQVQQLQGSMQDMVKIMTMFTSPTTAGKAGKEQSMQTEIVAVHTPQGEGAKSFPFHKQPSTRPSSLPLPVGQRTPKRDTQTSTTSLSTVDIEVRQFAGSLVDGVIKTVSENKDDCIMGMQETAEITVTDTEK